MNWLIKRQMKEVKREQEGENPAWHRLHQLFFLAAGVILVPLGIWGDSVNAVILGVVFLVGLLFYRIDLLFSKHRKS